MTATQIKGWRQIDAMDAAVQEVVSAVLAAEEEQTDGGYSADILAGWFYDYFSDYTRGLDLDVEELRSEVMTELDSVANYECTRQWASDKI